MENRPYYNENSLDLKVHEFDPEEVSIEKVVSVVMSKLDISNKISPIVMYDDPFDFYTSTSYDGVELKFSAQELLKSCNKQNCEDTPLFLDIDDMMTEMSECLGGSPLLLVVQELKNDNRILACTRKI